jgi:hypothetical protein
MAGPYKTINPNDVRVTTSFLNQLVDVVAQDVSSSASASTRRQYQVFVTGGVGPGVTSSLFQTVYDQDFSLQTSNPMFDMTIGIFSGSSTVSACSTGVDTNGKLLFNSRSIMMREKISNYRQFAQLLLGDADLQFASPFGDTTTANKLNHTLFLTFKRLFHRDGIKRETFAMKFFQTGTMTNKEDPDQPARSTLDVTSQSGSIIFTDVGSSQNLEKAQSGGTVGNIVAATNTARNVGNIFYQQGIVVLDLDKVISGSQHVSGTISGVANSTEDDLVAGQVFIGAPNDSKQSGNIAAKYIPDLMISGSIDDIINHIASCRFGSDSTVSMTFQNETVINSTLYFCRAAPDEFNFSSNPTYTDGNGQINVVQAGQVNQQKPFSFVTTVGLYNAQEALLAVAKMSRPIEKNEEKDVTFRVRLDF